MSGPTRPVHSTDDISPASHDDGAPTPPSRRNWLLIIIVALIAAILALFAAIDLGGGWHWLLWTLAAALFVAAVAAHVLSGFSRRRNLKSWLAIGSIIFSIITILIWATNPHGQLSTASTGRPSASAAPTPGAAPQGSNIQSASPAPAPAPQFVPYPDPNQPGVDETAGTNDAVPGSQHLVELRSAAAQLQLLPGDDDFRAPYSPAELQRLAAWELDYIRQHPSDPKITDLARHIGMAGNPDGNALADYLVKAADLKAVGPGGLHVNNFTYNGNGEVVYSEEATLPEGSLVWFRKDNLPIIRWACLNWLVPAS